MKPELTPRQPDSRGQALTLTNCQKKWVTFPSEMWTQLLCGPVRVLPRGDNLLQEELKSRVENPPMPSGELEPHPGVRLPALQVRRHVVMVLFSSLRPRQGLACKWGSKDSGGNGFLWGGCWERSPSSFPGEGLVLTSCWHTEHRGAGPRIYPIASANPFLLVPTTHPLLGAWALGEAVRNGAGGTPKSKVCSRAMTLGRERGYGGTTSISTLLPAPGAATWPLSLLPTLPPPCLIFPSLQSARIDCEKEHSIPVGPDEALSSWRVQALGNTVLILV